MRRRKHRIRYAERVTETLLYHGEGPFWDAPTKRFMCVDLHEGAIVSIDVNGESTRHNIPAAVTTVVRRRASGGYVIATRSGLIAADDDLLSFQRLANIHYDNGCRTNDGGCDPFGAFVIGTMTDDGRTNGGAVYRVMPDCSVTTLLSPVSIGNGIQWSADGEKAFFVDTPTRRVDVFDVDHCTGAWSARRSHIDLGRVRGLPDGIAIAEDDGLWVALWGGGAVNHYDAMGCLVESIRVPGVTQVSSCAFGGDARDVLYITTSRQGLTAGQEPFAGAIFAVDTNSRGANLREFAG